MSTQKRATLISSSVALGLTLLKLVVGILSGSVTVLASALDSVLDFFVSVFNFFALKKSEEPENATFNYGKGKVEALAALIEGVIISLSGLYIMYESVNKVLNQESVKYLDVSIGVMLASIVITFLLVRYLEGVAKKTDNMVIKSDALHYKTDLYSNAVILVSLCVVYATGLELIDAFMGFALGGYIIYSAFELIKEGTYVLLDASLEDDIVDEIKEIIKKCNELNDFHYLKTRKSANTYYVDVHLVFVPTITLLEAHNTSDKIEARIRSLDTNKRWVITTHLDPYDDKEGEAKR